MRFAGFYYWPVFTAFKYQIFLVEAQLAFYFIGAMSFVAVVGKDGPYLGSEFNFLFVGKLTAVVF